MRSNESVSSFDLLLDTITNTFGGILFLAMLVVSLLRITQVKNARSQQTVPSPQSVVGLESDFEEVLGRRQEIRQALAIQGKIIRDLAPNKKRDALEQLQATKERRAELTELRDQTLQRIAQSQKEVAGIAAELETFDKQLEAATRDVSGLKSQLKTEIESRTSTARLPRARHTSKREIAIAVRYGRVYLPYRTIMDRIGGKLNSEDMAVIAGDGTDVRVTPKPYAGLSISGTGSFPPALADKLTPYASDDYYIAVAIWDDCFAEFEILKRALVKLGYEYRLIPVSEGECITEGPVSDILVQ